MIEIGRLCVKIAGRDAKGKCIVVDIIDKNNVLVDGQVRRKKCSIKHLFPLKETIKIKKGASHADIVKEFKKLNIAIKESKAKKTAPRPRKQKKAKKAVEEKKPEKLKETKETKPKAKKPEKAKKPKK